MSDKEIGDIMVKLMAHTQHFQETMDELRGTGHYDGQLKILGNQLHNHIARRYNKVLEKMYGKDDLTMTRILQGIERGCNIMAENSPYTIADWELIMQKIDAHAKGDEMRIELGEYKCKCCKSTEIELVNAHKIKS